MCAGRFWSGDFAGPSSAATAAVARPKTRAADKTCEAFMTGSGLIVTSAQSAVSSYGNTGRDSPHLPGRLPHLAQRTVFPAVLIGLEQRLLPESTADFKRNATSWDRSRNQSHF